MTHLARIAERVINRPLLLHPQKAEVILWVLGERVGLAPEAPSPEQNRFIGQPKMLDRFTKAYTVVDGVAVITIEGSLVNRGEWIGANSGLVSYEGIEAQLAIAMTDANVQAIVFDIDSGGGEATGMYGLASKIRTARQGKPIVAVVNDIAASAAYGIASQADEIVVSPTSVVGSIGVVLMHIDASKMMEMKGQTATLIYAGAHKVDGHPFGPLPDAVRADLQREVETFYDRFIETVVAGREGRLSDEAARKTEARVYIGQEAIALGLADRVGGSAEAIALASFLAAERRVSTGDPAGRPKSSSGGAPAAAPKTELTMDWKDINAESLKQNRPDLVLAIEGAHDIAARLAASRLEGVAAGSAAERERILGIQRIALAGHEPLVAEMVGDGKTTPPEAAMKLIEAAKAKGPDQLANIAAMDRHVRVPANQTAQGGGSEAKTYTADKAGWMAEWKDTPALQADYVTAEDYAAAKQAEAGGRVKTVGPRDKAAA